jgi:hypothetical protein
MAKEKVHHEFISTGIAPARAGWLQFGWHAACMCGWQQESPFWGTKKVALREYYKHREEASANEDSEA